ncbi:MAG: hypothetical protein L0G15_07440, partial [Bifidobacterium mongoliense]|nr:hypothetical protein [Bifidobacterium mongoliense]
MLKAYRGDIIFTPTPQEFSVLEDGFVLVEDGTVKDVVGSLGAEYAEVPVIDRSGCLIIPGFNDLHVHAPQYPQAGLGFDCELLPWLDRYTFVDEARFADPDVAER